MEGNSLKRYIEIYNSYFIAEKLKEKPFGHINCPIFDMSCPCCLASGECVIGDPMNECDDYYYYHGGEED